MQIPKFSLPKDIFEAPNEFMDWCLNNRKEPTRLLLNPNASDDPNEVVINLANSHERIELEYPAKLQDLLEQLNKIFASPVFSVSVDDTKRLDRELKTNKHHTALTSFELINLATEHLGLEKNDSIVLSEKNQFINCEEEQGNLISNSRETLKPDLYQELISASKTLNEILNEAEQSSADPEKRADYLVDKLREKSFYPPQLSDAEEKESWATSLYASQLYVDDSQTLTAGKYEYLEAANPSYTVSSNEIIKSLEQEKDDPFVELLKERMLQVYLENFRQATITHFTVLIPEEDKLQKALFSEAKFREDLKDSIGPLRLIITPTEIMQKVFLNSV